MAETDLPLRAILPAAWTRRSIALRDERKKHRTIADEADLTVCQAVTLRREIIRALLIASDLGFECQWYDEAPPIGLHRCSPGP